MAAVAYTPEINDRCLAALQLAYKQVTPLLWAPHCQTFFWEFLLPHEDCAGLVFHGRPCTHGSMCGEAAVVVTTSAGTEPGSEICADQSFCASHGLFVEQHSGASVRYYNEAELMTETFYRYYYLSTETMGDLAVVQLEIAVYEALLPEIQLLNADVMECNALLTEWNLRTDCFANRKW